MVVRTGRPKGQLIWIDSFLSNSSSSHLVTSRLSVTESLLVRRQKELLTQPF